MAFNISPFRFDYDTRVQPIAPPQRGVWGPVDIRDTLAKFAELPQVIGEAFQGARRYRGEEDYIRQLQELQALQRPGGPYAQGPRLPTIAGMEGTAPTTNTYAFLRKEEGFRSKPYWDVNAPRAGYGSDTTTIPETGQVLPVTPNIRVTKDMAEADLSRRTAEFQDNIRRVVPGFDAMPEGTKTALTSVAYNYGRLPASVVRAAISGNEDVLRGAVKNLRANPERRDREASLIGKGAAEGETRPLAFTVRPPGAVPPPPIPPGPPAGGAPPLGIPMGGGVPQPPGPPPPPPLRPDQPQQPPAMQNGQPLFPEPQFASLPGMQMPPPTAGGPGAPPAPMAAPAVPMPPPPPQSPPGPIPGPQMAGPPSVPPASLAPPPRMAPQAAPPPVPMPAGGMADLMAAAVRSGRPDLVRATQQMMTPADPSERYQIINAGQGRVLRVDKATGQAEDITPPSAPGAAPELFTGNSVEGQALNLLVQNGRMTPQQAAQWAASKTVTSPDGTVRVVTPEQLFAAAGIGGGGPGPGPPAEGGGVGTAVTGPRPPAPLSDETAGKAGLAKDYLTVSVPKLKERIRAGAISDLKARGMMYYGFGEPGELKTDQANGTDALVRSLTGAGMGIQEAKDYAQRFAFRPVDTQADMLRKVNTLERLLKASFGEIFRNKKISSKELEVLESDVPQTSPGGRPFERVQ